MGMATTKMAGLSFFKDFQIKKSIFQRFMTFSSKQPMILMELAFILWQITAILVVNSKEFSEKNPQDQEEECIFTAPQKEKVATVGA